MIVVIVLYGFVLWEIGAPSPQPLDTKFLVALALVSLGALAAGLVARRKLIGPAFETLRQKPDDATALGQWRRGVVISAALGESIVLFGVVIYLIGGASRQAAPFFVVGTLVMLLWWPRRP
jgi:F0F1-type ATP synthase membrane subunit c/vacuolar-type H+-ATPase subunit K